MGVQSSDVRDRLDAETLDLFGKMVEAHLEAGAGDKPFIRADTRGGCRLIFSAGQAPRDWRGFNGGSLDDLASFGLLHLGCSRANRVFPDKDSGLIVDYVGVFRNLKAALAIYGASREGGGNTPIQPKDGLALDLAEALDELATFLDAHDIDLSDLERATGFEFVALQKSAVGALLVDDATRRKYVTLARRVRTVFKSLLPDPAAQAMTHEVAVIRSLAAKLESSSEAPDIRSVMDWVSELLDRSVGAEEYVIRAGGDAGPLVDLNKLDFEQLALRFVASKRTAARQIEQNLEKRFDSAVRKNPTRIDLAERFRRLIDEYNAGTHNLEQFLRRLKAISDELTEEEQRTVREELNEDELAIYDLLTKPEPELTKAEQIQVKSAAKHLWEQVTDKLVLDWRKRQQTRSAVRVAVGTVLDSELPEVYGPELFDEKVERVYEHIYASYFDNGESVYTGAIEETPPVVPVATVPSSAAHVGDDLLEQIKSDPDLFTKVMEEVFFTKVMEEVFGLHETWTKPTEQLLAEETKHVEFKQSAGWSVTSADPKVHKTLAEEIIAKTVAGFLNGQGDTLLSASEMTRWSPSGSMRTTLTSSPKTPTDSSTGSTPCSRTPSVTPAPTPSRPASGRSSRRRTLSSSSAATTPVRCPTTKLTSSSRSDLEI